MLMSTDLKEDIVSETHEVQRKRPSGGQIVVWGAVVFCALLAVLNAATPATSDWIRVLLIVGGVVLIGVFVTQLTRWYRKNGKPTDQTASH